MKILREFKEPTSIVICDAYNENRQADVLIDDDECGFTVRDFNGACEYVESFGFIYIFTKEEFLNHIKDPNNEKDIYEHEYWNRYVVINGFVGQIGATAEVRGGQPTDEWDTKDYFHHQDLDANLFIDVVGEHEFKVSNLKEALEILESGKGSKISDKLSDETKEQLIGEIDNEGLGYWVQHYGYKGDEDEELAELCVKARRILNKLEERLEKLGVEI